MTEQAQSAATVSSDQALGWYRQMVHIRKFEEKVVELSGRGLVSGSTHPCIAQEAVSVGCISALSGEDLVLATYRGHGAFLARGGDPKAAMAEILCRETGCCKGKGGSMHLCDPDIGFLGTNAIVAAHIPIASGVALANQLKKTNRVTLCLFGDGASCEGAFYETLNMVALWKIPVVLVCENNGYAISVPVKKSLSVAEIATRAQGFDMPGISIDGNDILEVYETTRQAVERAREGGGPTLIECRTVRWERHSALSAGFYESREERKRWQVVDPIPRFRTLLIEQMSIPASVLEEIDQEAEEAAEEAAELTEGCHPEPVHGDVAIGTGHLRLTSEGVAGRTGTGRQRRKSKGEPEMSAPESSGPRVILCGVGGVGRRVTRLLSFRPGYRVVAAYTRNRDLAGQDLGSLAGIEPNGSHRHDRPGRRPAATRRHRDRRHHLVPASGGAGTASGGGTQPQRHHHRRGGRLPLADRRGPDR